MSGDLRNSFLKKATDAAHDAARLFYGEGEIWWVRLGKDVGYECSRQADEKGLKGKVRKKFRSKCLKDMKKKTPAQPLCAVCRHSQKEQCWNLTVSLVLLLRRNR